MLAQLATLKACLAIAVDDTQYDDLLTSALAATSAMFEKECNRTFARTVDATFEFDLDDVELVPPIYPIESVSKFETKEDETEGWVEQTGIKYVIRNGCIISLKTPLPVLSTFSGGGNDFGLARITYTGGFLLPGSADVPSATPLPSDLEQAAIEQAASWFMNRDKIGLTRYWPKGGIYLEFLKTYLLPNVRSALDRYQRIQF
jgi:hypothetical protein